MAEQDGSGSAPLPAFSATGIEIEYMIVDRASYDVRPLTDELLHAVAGNYDGEVDCGETAWSNELALHVVELKTKGPAPALAPVPAMFERDVGRINALLAARGACLMPGAAHPWMDPDRELRLWPHANDAIYAAFNRIFDCRGHGWANLQSMHVNLPFAGDEEFERLHTGIRTVLPILPALAASSPIVGARASGLLDTRLQYYRANSRAIPSITGHLVPEPVRSRAEYEREILAPMYRDIAPHDPDGLLQAEWLNARGAIARFDRNAIEIRVLDTQEHASADLAVAAAVIGAVRFAYDGRWRDGAAQRALPTERLAAILVDAIAHGERAVVRDRAYLRAYGLAESALELRELWMHLLESGLLSAAGVDPAWRAPLDVIIERGPLARRILDSCGAEPGPDRLARLARELCACLSEGRAFLGLP
jgi:gamma-glutamyl:cysteine ligase YbdK (ATP-grasp superfamily)